MKRCNKINTYSTVMHIFNGCKLELKGLTLQPTLNFCKNDYWRKNKKITKP